MLLFELLPIPFPNPTPNPEFLKKWEWYGSHVLGSPWNHPWINSTSSFLNRPVLQWKRPQLPKALRRHLARQKQCIFQHLHSFHANCESPKLLKWLARSRIEPHVNFFSSFSIYPKNIRRRFWSQRFTFKEKTTHIIFQGINKIPVEFAKDVQIFAASFSHFLGCKKNMRSQQSIAIGTSKEWTGRGHRAG